jgi:hypothetical protein
MVSKCFASLCEEYYERSMKLNELIASDVPEDDVFMKAINSGPNKQFE